MKISQSIFTDYIKNFKLLLDELFKHEKFGNEEKGWVKYEDKIKVFKTEKQEDVDAIAKIFNKIPEKVTGRPELKEEWGYGILNYDSVCNMFLENVLIMKNGYDYRIYSINVGQTKAGANQKGFYYSKLQYPTLTKVKLDFKTGDFKHYNSLINSKNELCMFNEYTDRLAVYNWLYEVISYYLEDYK